MELQLTLKQVKLFNKMNLRHNNSDPETKNFVPFMATIEEHEIEKWYDETYQMCLLAFLELDNIERTEKLDALKKNYKSWLLEGVVYE